MLKMLIVNSLGFALLGAHSPPPLQPWSVSPNMSASLASGTASGREGANLSANVHVFDKDTWTNGVDYPVLRGGSIEFQCTFLSGDGSAPIVTQYADDLDAGTWDFTVTHKLRMLPAGMNSELYVDTYVVKDLGTMSSFLKDSNITLQQQVTVTK